VWSRNVSHSFSTTRKSRFLGSDHGRMTQDRNMGRLEAPAAMKVNRIDL
jgi:hypothetical protein